MSTGSMVALGILAGVMIAAWALSRKSRKTTEYDEMQLKIRAKGYQIGFYTALLLQMVMILLLELDVLTMVTPGFAAFAVLMISVVVFAIYCILHDAFIAVRGKTRSYIWIFSLVILADGFTTVRHLTDGGLTDGGKLTFSAGSSALVCLGFLAVLITLIVKTVRDGKEAEE